MDTIKLSRTRLKVCGITNLADAQAAVAAGVDALGFVFASSPRQVSPDLAKQVISALPPFVVSVALFVNEDVERINELVRYCAFDRVQLHGDEPDQQIPLVVRPVIKAIRVKDHASVALAQSYRAPAAILLDAYQPGVRGGTGASFNWELIQGAKWQLPLILAGGIGPQNAAAAIAQVRPFALDVSSGVESQPGKKDARLLLQMAAAMANY